MKKLIQIISTATVAVSLLAGTAAAVAETGTCGTISNTGPGSDNTITCVVDNNTNIVCNNDLKVELSNDQSGDSGSGSTSGNTSGGFTTTGNVDNNNVATVAIGASCAPVTVASTTTVTPTPAAGGQGAAVATPAAKPAAPKSLPETGSNTAQKLGLDSLVVLGGTLGLSQVVLRAYRRLALR